MTALNRLRLRKLRTYSFELAVCFFLLCFWTGVLFPEQVAAVMDAFQKWLYEGIKVLLGV